MSHDTTDAYHAERIRAQIALLDRIPARVADSLACWSMAAAPDRRPERGVSIRPIGDGWHVRLYDGAGPGVTVPMMVDADDWSPLLDLLHHWSPPCD